MNWWVDGRLSWPVVGLAVYVTLVLMLGDLTWRLTALSAHVIGAALFLFVAVGFAAAVFFARRRK